MIPQKEADTSYETLLEKGSPRTEYSLVNDRTNMLRLIWFGVAMVALLAFAVICLMMVGGTAGWIGFIAASFTIMVIVSTAISNLK
jgi:hypothetical protein